MDFFSAKADALRRSRRLEWLFALAVTTCVGVLTLFTLFQLALQRHGSGSAEDPGPEALARVVLDYVLEFPELTLWIAGFWMLVVLVPWIGKAISLARGGRIVAESLGGTRVVPGATDPLLRRLHNVTEEMAIASGIAVPAVYVLEEEPSINAFAAGHRPSNAAIAVTRGALNRLSRDELQGVVAHEFSHILNGDMKLNMRMIGWIAGLSGITAFGRAMLRIRARDKVSPLIFFGVILMVVGALGTLAGRMLQAAVCRQREWLADASAVQFTRNPAGLRNALLRISQGGDVALRSNQTPTVAHLLFASGFRRSLFATHPPVRDRIEALGQGPQTPPPLPPVDPVREGLPPAPEPAQGRRTSALPDLVLALDTPQAAQPAPAQSPPTWMTTQDLADTVVAAIGHPDASQVMEAQGIVQALPAFVRAAAESTDAARGLVLALLVSRDPDPRERQLSAIEIAMGGKVMAQARVALGLLAELAPSLRLPAVFELIGPLAQAGKADQVSLANVVHRLAVADGEIDMFEFCVRRLVVKSLKTPSDSLSGRRHPEKSTTVTAVSVLLSVLAHQGASGDEQEARRAFQAGAARLDLARPPVYALPQSWSAALWSALDDIDRLDPLAHRTLLRALVATIAHDGRLTRAESELLQLTCAALGCPVPPLSALIRDDLTLLN